MRFLIQKSLFGLAVVALVVGCGTDISGNSEEDPDPGSADFSTFVALGDSLTAGIADFALYRHGQENSFPAIMAQQFALAGGGAFTQPLMPVGATGSLTLTGIGDLGLADRLVLVPTGDPASPASPAPIMPTQSTSIDVPLVGPFNNVGVAGAKSYHLGANTYGDPASLPAANPYYIRFASSTGATMIGDAAGQVPSFFVLWIGNNDVLSYALAGGTGVDQNAANNLDPSTYGASDITDDVAFTGIYTGLVAALKVLPTTKGVLINIPDVSTIPHFTTVPFNAIPFDATQAADANAGFALYNIGVASRVGMAPGPPPGGACGITQAESDRRQITFAEGQNRVVILDENLTNLVPCLGPAAVNMRQATADDFIILPTLSKLGEDAGGGLLWGISAPLLDADVLIDTEVAAVDAARTAYNATIRAAADADPDLLLFDASAKLTELNTTGINYGSGGISSTFAQGGAFSLDGVHPTARGYAVIANEIFEVINEGFGANIPPVNPNDYTTVFYQ